MARPAGPHRAIPACPQSASAVKPAAPAVETPQPVLPVGAAQIGGAERAGVGRQIGETVVRELESMAMTRFASTEQSVGGKTVKMLSFQLNPAELGKVNIRLHSVDGELRISIRAESDRVAQMIAGDGDMIMSTLRAGRRGGPGHHDLRRPERAGALPEPGQCQQGPGDRP